MKPTETDIKGVCKAKDTIAVFAAVIVLTLATIYYLMRIGFDNPIGPLLKVVTVSFWVLFSPQGFRFIRNRFNMFRQEAWFTTDAFAVLVALFLLVLAGVLVQFINVNFIVLFSIAGLCLALVTLARWLMDDTKKISALFLAFAGLIGIWVAAFIWGQDYQSPILLERLIFGGIATRDAMFQIAVANMVRYYQTASTGLYGTPFLAYHTGSHWIFVQLASLLNVSSFDFYQLGYPVMFIPLLFYSLLSFAIDLRPKVNSDRWQLELRRDGWFWCIFVAGTVGVIPLSLQSTLWGSFFVLISESYCVAIAVIFLTLSLFISFNIEPLKNGRVRLGDVLFLFLLAPLMVAVSGFIKISVMLVMYGVLGYLLLRLRLYRNRFYLVSFLLLTLLCSVLYWLIHFPESISISLFDFERTAIRPADWLPYWPLVNFLGVWLFVGLRFQSSGIRTIGDVRQAFLGRTLVDVEIVLVTAVISVLPGLLLYIPAFNAVYFSDSQRWLPLGMLLGYATAFSMTGNPLASIPFKPITNLRISQIAQLLFAATIAYTTINNGLLVGRSFLHRYVTERNSIENNYAVMAQLHHAILTFNISQIEAVVANEVVPLFASSQQQALNKEKGYAIVQALLDLNDKLSPMEKKQTALFIPKSNTLYWNLVGDCYATPFVAPALSGLAQIQGLPLPTCKDPHDFGYWAYDSELQNEKPLAANDSTGICERARTLHFSRVEILDMDSTGHIIERLLDCQSSL
jgi:hypothetical protein